MVLSLFPISVVISATIDMVHATVKRDPPLDKPIHCSPAPVLVPDRGKLSPTVSRQYVDSSFI